VCHQQTGKALCATSNQLKSLALSLQMLSEESDWLWEDIQTFGCSLSSSELNTSTSVDCISGEQELDIGTNTDCTLNVPPKNWKPAQKLNAPSVS